MKKDKILDILRIVFVVVLVLPLFAAWIPMSVYESSVPENLLKGNFFRNLVLSFQELSLTLVATVIFAMLLAVLMGYMSVLSIKFGHFLSSVNNAVESIPSILIALFLYAPVSGALAKTSHSKSTFLSLVVFVLAATVTVLPEAVRSVSIPLSDLYDKKYSVSFRSYGFTKNRILRVLMKMDIMKASVKRVAAGILLKTLVLDTSLGYVIQCGLGSTGTPSHTSPGALVAANRKELLLGGTNPEWFWIPTALLIAVSVAFLLVIKKDKEEE